MRWIGICLMYLYCIQHAASQNVELIPIVNHHVLSLDSRGSTLFTGNHTAVIEIDLPVNTVRWYYRFYNVQQKEVLSDYTPQYSFLDDLALKIKEVGHTLKVPNIPSALKNKVSIYLLQDSSQVSVLNKQLLFQKVEYKEEFSVLNNSSGWMEVCDPQYVSGKQYIGFLNHGNLSGTHVVLDIVAVCRKRSLELHGWSEIALRDVEFEIVDQLSDKVNSVFLEKISTCVIQSLQQKMIYTDYDHLSVKSKNQLHHELLDICSHKNLESSPDTLLELNSFYLIGKWKTEKGETLHFKASSEIILNKKSGEIIQGNWYIQDELLIVNFEKYKTQKYQPIVISPVKFIWRNLLTGNYLRYQRLIKL